MLAGRIHEIRTIFDQNHKLVRHPVLPHENKQKEVLELEAKYGYYTDRGFNSNVPYIHYERLLNYLRASPDVQEDLEESTVTQAGNIRRIVIINPGDGNETVIWQRKRRLRDIELKDYDIRISVNIEETITDENPVLTGQRVIRERTRHSFLMRNGLVKVDMTEVMMKAEDQVVRPRYEVELEYLGAQENLDVFVKQVDYIFRRLRGTNIIYSNQIKDKLIRDTIRILGGAREDMIDKDVLVEARNIKRRDLVYGGIVGNNHLIDNKVLATPRRQGKTGKGTGYMITFKADGFRKMLIIHSTGIWLVYPPFEFNLALDTSLNVPQLDRLLTNFNGTIFDGELVIPKTPKAISYWYLAFDCLAFRGSSGVQVQSYTERQKVVNAISGAIKTPILTIDTKDTEEIKTPKDFFRLVRKFLDRRDELDYDEDGLMFIPIDTCYNPHSQRHELKDRSLTQVPDVCKWKEGADITIDFALKWVDGGKLELHSYDEKLNTTVPFTGDNINPLTPDMIDHTNQLTLNKPANLVVEYEWVNIPRAAQPLSVEGTLSVLPKLNQDMKSGIFRPRRIRYDKTGPNRLSVALDDWEDIMHPILEEDIRGDTLTMTFSYHNRIKRILYNILTTNPDFNPKVKGSKRYIGVNILDIGSGFGGDAPKWIRLTNKDDDKNTGVVIAVEPNPDNRQELINRIGTYNLQNKVVVVPTGGEDTATITDTVRKYVPGGKVDAITLMLSMSFFWASDAHLDALVNTIVNNLKPGGKIVFLTIDGDTIEQIFEPVIGPHITDLAIASANLHLYPKFRPPFGRPLDFILPNTIVGIQREYIVHLQDFTSRLSNYGIHLYEIHRAEGEQLLSDDNSLFSSMYSYGYYINDDKIALLQHDQPEYLPTNTILPNIPAPIKSPVTQMNPDLPILQTTSPTITIVGTPLPSTSPRLVQQTPIPGSPVLPILQSSQTVQKTVPAILPSPVKLPSPVNSPNIPKISTPRLPTPKIISPPGTPKVPIQTVTLPSPGISPNIPKISTPRLPTPKITSPPGTPKVPIQTVTLPLIPQIPKLPFTPTKVKISKFQIDQNQLEWLPVSYTNRGGHIMKGPAVNDDTYAPLTCTWYDNLVRIASIGDGSCFIHAVLKGFYRVYQENNGAQFRLNLAAKVRRDLAIVLGLENPQYPGHTYWETSARGSFPRMVMQQINDEKLVGDLGVDYSLAGLQRLFNSTSQLGDEVYTFVADALGIDIYVLRATRQDLYPHYHTRRPGILRNGIVIIGNMYHYEVLAVDTHQKFQTVFPPNDPFIEALTILFVGDGDFNDIVNTIPYNPDEAFISDFVDAFTTARGLVIPPVIKEIFPPTDPFFIALEKSLPLIEKAAEGRVMELINPATIPAENPVMTKLNQLLRIMTDSGYPTEQATYIREIVQHKLIPDIPQDLHTIITSALTDGLLTQQTVDDILNTEATL